MVQHKEQCIMAEEKEKRAPDMESEGAPARPFSEQLEVAGEELVERVKQLVQQGNIRRLVIKSADGRILLQIPLTLGMVVGGGLMFFYPILAMLTAIGGLVARVHIEVIREEGDVMVSELNVETEEVAKKAEAFVSDVGKRLERMGKSAQDTAEDAVSTAKRKVELEDTGTENNLQA
jgi:hypothetical protein